MRILLSSVGRRVELVRVFRRALEGRGEVLAADMDRTAPGLYVADQGFLVPGTSSPDYVPALLEICRRQRVAAVVPLVDPELPVLARCREEFERAGTTILVAGPEAIECCFDKLNTAAFLRRLSVPTPATYTSPDDAGPGSRVVKPRCGSAGKGVHICRSLEEVRFWFGRTSQPMIQEYVDGDEITVDVLCDLTGRPVQQVQRKRLKVRGGEVERGVTVAHPEIARYALKIAAALAPRGVINVQCFLTGRGPRFTEINPRFGGGYPLAHAAGAGFPERVIEMLDGKPTPAGGAGCRAGVVMMRFDEAVYLSETELLG